MFGIWRVLFFLWNSVEEHETLWAPPGTAMIGQSRLVLRVVGVIGVDNSDSSILQNRLTSTPVTNSISV